MRAFTILVLTAIKLFDSHAVPAFASVAIPKSLQQTFDVTEAIVQKLLSCCLLWLISNTSSLALKRIKLNRDRAGYFLTTVTRPRIKLRGQLVRVGLAWSTLPNPPHVLLLDEPTNHLDMVTIEMLRKALRKYQGAVVIISHDLHFLDILTNRSKQEEADDGITRCGCVRIVEVIKKKGLVSLLPLEGVEAYREKEERRNASLGRM
ncbi:unnamed protein product [Peronospora belbahrii]|uniref:ABC transporter domain-containing protein n=1 Tax=Peronospora belbahrii TaxID=622444 RepID=A0ABN8CP85_9STRA|nr:unnamed protein product [Peronospora belbahrii]